MRITIPNDVGAALNRDTVFFFLLHDLFCGETWMPTVQAQDSMFAPVAPNIKGLANETHHS